MVTVAALAGRWLGQGGSEHEVVPGKAETSGVETASLYVPGLR